MTTIAVSMIATHRGSANQKDAAPEK